MRNTYPPVLLKLAEPRARLIIWILSGIVFLAVLLLNRMQIQAPEGLDVHLFAKVNAILNSAVSALLLVGLFTAKAGKWRAHRNVMLGALSLSVLFLGSYILHHLFAGETSFGGEGAVKWLYYIILITHVILAATSLPFILTTAYKAASGRYPEHRAMAKRVWPVWFYVALTGVVVYVMISPYY